MHLIVLLRDALSPTNAGGRASRLIHMLCLSIIEYHLGLNTILKHKEENKRWQWKHWQRTVRQSARRVFSPSPQPPHTITSVLPGYPLSLKFRFGADSMDMLC
jgi:hypothetical protein